MIYLVYNLHLTAYTVAHLDEFWVWVARREPWFYSGLDMVRDLRWYVVHDHDGTIVVQHFVGFDSRDDIAVYYTALNAKRQDPSFERRRTEQDRWYSIPGGSRLATDPPIALGHSAEPFAQRMTRGMVTR